MNISPASIDRLLAGRRPQLRKSRGFTKPGTLLKHQIPIRTWADWTDRSRKDVHVTRLEIKEMDTCSMWISPLQAKFQSQCSGDGLSSVAKISSGQC